MMKKTILFWIVAVTAMLGSAAASETVTVPAIPEIELTSGGPDEPFWREAAVVFPKLNFKDESKTSKVKTEVRLIMDRKNLYLAVSCEEPLAISAAKPGENPWRGDCVEIFFARRNRPAWYRHLIVGADGRRANLMLHESQWSAITVREKNRWSTKLTLPLSALGKLDGDLGFNVVRTRQAARELITWRPLQKQMLAPEKFGRIALTGSPAELFHSPWTFQIASGSAGIAWETFRTGPGIAFLRQKGETRWRQLRCSTKDGTVHSVRATGLRENTVYEYWVPGAADFGEFRTLSSTPGDFAFILTTDIHCRARQLADLLKQPQAQNAELLFLLGDQIDASMVRENHYDGFLDDLLAVWKRPFYCLYGNHESRGAARNSFYEPFCGNGPGYWSFVHKGVCFVLLDTDHDGRISPDCLKEQTEFLRRTVKTPEFRQAQWRVLLLHVPLTFRPDKRWGEDNFALMQALTPAERDSFDAAFSGHTHVYCRTRPGEKTVFSAYPKLARTKIRPFAFPEFTGPQLGLIRVEKTADTLAVEVFAPSGERLDRQVIHGVPAKGR